MLAEGWDPPAATSHTSWQTVIVGAGAAGLSAGTLFAAHAPRETLLLEAHAEPGGCAGYFARGFPRRVHDAGATQLVEYRPGGLQYELLKCALSFGSAQVSMPEARPITFLDHVWPIGGAGAGAGSVDSLRWNAHGRLETGVLGGGLATLPETHKGFEAFMARCSADANILWRLFYRFPDLPLHSLQDAVQLARTVWPPDLKSLVLGLGALGQSVDDVARRYGISSDPKVKAIVEALLLDTAQNDARRTPYLVGAMGLSILQRGIVRLEEGMKSLFKPWLLGVRASGLTARTGACVVALSSRRSGGFDLTVRIAGKSGSSLVTVQARDVILALPLPAILALVPEHDPLRLTPAWQSWQHAVSEEHEWQAFVVHGVLVGRTPAVADEQPWYLQVFATPSSVVPHALYVSCGPAQWDSRTGQVWRVFTASVHASLDDDEFRRLPVSAHGSQVSGGQGPSEAWLQRCQAIHKELIDRVQSATGLRVQHASLATPKTFERYTGRPQGRVGGFAVTHRNSLFLAPPKVIEAMGGSRLVVAGDHVFPGQGVVAASMSGVLAWARLTGRSPRTLLDLRPPDLAEKPSA